MDQGKIHKIKNAVRANFDASPDPYQSFEETHGFFRMLSGSLLSRMRLPEAPDVLDVGCGTAASSVHILNALPGCRVWGIDISKAMLDLARARHPESERLSFVEGDAAKLTDYFDRPFDGIIYSASIFLIPDFEQSLRQSFALLKDGGSVALTFMDGLYDSKGNNLFQIADKEAGEGVSLKKPVDLTEFEIFFRGLFPVHTSWNEDFKPDVALLRAFYSVPAMSAGLFPGFDFRQRVGKVGRLFDLMPETEKIFRWRMMIGEKRN